MRTVELLRKKDLHPAVGVPKSTVADWIEDFNVYIPKVKHGSVTYYKPETIDVLLFIKQCREQHYQKNQIMEMLSEKGFPITVEEAVEDVKRALEGTNSRDTLLTVMQTMGQAVTKIAEQDERMDRFDERMERQDGALKTLHLSQSEQVGRIDDLEKRTDEIDYLKQEMELMKKQLAAAKEQLERTEIELEASKNKKGFFSRLFGFNNKNE